MNREKIKKIFDIVISIIVFGILGAWLVDFYNYYQGNEPALCIKEEVYEYEDGKTKSCTGLGYKVYIYERSSIEGMEFGPFWLEERN